MKRHADRMAQGRAALRQACSLHTRRLARDRRLESFESVGVASGGGRRGKLHAHSMASIPASAVLGDMRPSSKG